MKGLTLALSSLLLPAVRPRRSIRDAIGIADFHDTLRRERCRCERKGNEFSLVLFGLTDRFGDRISGDRLVQALEPRLRDTDEIGWFDNDWLGTLLTETSPTGARHFSSEARHLLARIGVHPAIRLLAYPTQWSAPQLSMPALRPSRETKVELPELQLAESIG